MKALVHTKYGSTDVLNLKEVEKPIPKDDQVLIRVHATTVNGTDCAILRAKPFFMRIFTGLLRPKKRTLGTDFAGQIESVGNDVESFKVGDKVFGFDDLRLGSHAQYLTLAADKAFITMPINSSYQQAAASIEGAHYALSFIKELYDAGKIVPIIDRTYPLIALAKALKYFEKGQANGKIIIRINDINFV